MPAEKTPRGKYDKLLTLIRGRMTIDGVSKETLAASIGKSRNTLTARLNDPAEFTLGELDAICLALDIPAEDMKAALPT